MTVDEVCILAEHFERILELRKKKKKNKATKFTALKIQTFQGFHLTNKLSIILNSKGLTYTILVLKPMSHL